MSFDVIKQLFFRVFTVGILFPGSLMAADSSEWSDTPSGYRLRQHYPRVLVSPSQLQTALERMYGPQAREPWKRWFDLVKSFEDSGNQVGLVELALLYRATSEQRYLERLRTRLPSTGVPSREELYAIDLVWSDISDQIKRRVMQRVGETDNPWYWNSINQSNSGTPNWGYHSAHGVAQALAYAGLFAYSDLEQTKDPSVARFNANRYIELVKKELSSEGYFYKIERRIAGDPTHNDALPGSFGGMYDNFGYDTGEEAHSVFVLLQYLNLTGEDHSADFLHDRYRGQFYQNMHYPYLYSYYQNNQWCRRAGTSSYTVARIWNTQTDWASQPETSTTLPLTHLYSDPRVQYYVKNGVQPELCGAPYSGMFWRLLYYDDSLPQEPPSTNPTAMYFSGPGLVSMRSDWSNDAAFAVFIAGEGISRRYEDGNSFIMGRKGDVFPHAGARIRFNNDNNRHHWYHIRSVSKNTLKIFDPNESFDIDRSNGAVTALHSGTPLVPSDNLGGQIFETPISTVDRSFNEAGVARYNCSAFPLGVCETANVIRYEHRPELGYTYTAGDATAAYTKKIDFFEREFFFLRPDVFIIFDRVQSVDPSFKKVWTVHTVDKPVLNQTAAASGPGMNSYLNARTVTINANRNITTIAALLPQLNKVVIRGGDTVLVREQPLSAGQGISGTAIEKAELDIPRWLEFLASGTVTNGSLIVTGDTESENGVSETVTFTDKMQTEANSRPSSMTSTSLTDNSAGPWVPNQFKNFMVRTSCNGGTYHLVITGNNENTIYSNFPNTSCWGYTIYRKVANSYRHFRRITSISSSDLNLTALTVSVPHYFDTVDALGRVHSFSPHTDQRDDQYSKRKDLGQYTIEIEAKTDSKLNNFLNVISLKDPGSTKPQVILAPGDNAAGALVESTLVVFAKGRQFQDARVTIPKNGSIRAHLCNLQPERTYYLKLIASSLEISTSNNGGQAVLTSTAGVATTTLSVNDTTAPAAPKNLRVGS